MASLNLKIKWDMPINEIAEEIANLTTYKLYAGDGMILISKADVAEILAKHIEVKSDTDNY